MLSLPLYISLHLSLSFSPSLSPSLPPSLSPAILSAPLVLVNALWCVAAVWCWWMNLTLLLLSRQGQPPGFPLFLSLPRRGTQLWDSFETSWFTHNERLAPLKNKAKKNPLLVYRPRWLWCCQTMHFLLFDDYKSQVVNVYSIDCAERFLTTNCNCATAHGPVCFSKKTLFSSIYVELSTFHCCKTVPFALYFLVLMYVFPWPKNKTNIC